MEVKVYNQKGEESGKAELPADIFEVKNNPDLVYQVVTTQAANRRQGNAHTKNRGDVSGGGKKPWRQKGTGRARHGSNRSPIWRHGGVVFGPRSNKVYGGKINKKMRQAALCMALSAKAGSDSLVVVDTLKPAEPKTKIIALALTNLKKNIDSFKKGTILIAIPQFEASTVRATRNLHDVKTLEASKLNALDVLSSKYLLLPQESIEVISGILKGSDKVETKEAATVSELKKLPKKTARPAAKRRVKANP